MLWTRTPYPHRKQGQTCTAEPRRSCALPALSTMRSATMQSRATGAPSSLCQALLNVAAGRRHVHKSLHCANDCCGSSRVHSQGFVYVLIWVYTRWNSKRHESCRCRHNEVYWEGDAPLCVWAGSCLLSAAAPLQQAAQHGQVSAMGRQLLNIRSWHTR